MTFDLTPQPPSLRGKGGPIERNFCRDDMYYGTPSLGGKGMGVRFSANEESAR